QGRSRVPALFVMMEMDPARDPRLGLETRDIGRDKIPAATVKHFPKREQGRQDRRRRMAAKRVADIVEIESMRRGAVDERRIERCGPLTAAENQTFAARFWRTRAPQRRSARTARRRPPR